MCDTCNEITIPQGPEGPQGETGATGPAGTNGTNGTNGVNGVNGTTILASYNSTTGVGTPAGLIETTLFTYNIPANTLSANNSELELYAYYEYINNDPVTLRIKLGSKVFTLSVADADDDLRILKIKISRISTTSQIWVIENLISTGTGGNIIGVINVDTSTVDLSTILSFEITAQNTVNGAGQLMLKKATLYKYSI